MIKKDFLKNNSKSIVVYNPLSNVGHFDSWCSIFVKVLLENNWAVVVITKNQQVLFEKLAGYKEHYKTKLLVLDQSANVGANDKISVMGNIIKKIKIISFLESLKLNDRRINQSLFNIINSFIARVFNFLLRKLIYILSKYNSENLKISFNNPIDFASDIDVLVKGLGGKPAIVINMYLDLYDPRLKKWEKFSQKMYCKWVGIHMDLSHALKNRPYTRSKALKIIYTINESVKQTDHVLQYGINYQWLPDITDISVPVKVSRIVEDIKRLAAGRRIIFLGGAIGKTKNISLWAELFFKLNHDEWYFVQIGKIEYPTLTKDDLDGLNKLQKSKKDTIYISDAYLPDETIFNEVMSCSSVIWGLYRDFDRSSNILTKAALLYKPIIVSNRFLMGQRVNNYKIGIAVSETNVDDVIKGLESITNNPIPLENFEKYAKMYSETTLSKKLITSLEKII